MTASNKKGDGAAYQWILANQHHTGNECLFWPFSRPPQGYGNFGHLGKVRYAHRMMCELVNGPPPTPKHQASHSCGKGHLACVNPRHLSWKTQSENQKDRRKHGTHLGSKGSRTKFTPEQVADIRRSKGVETQLNTAKRYGVTRACIEYWQKTTHEPAPPGMSPSSIARRLRTAA